MKPGFFYIMSNIKRDVFYCGVTSHIAHRVNQHKSGEGSAFTSKYKTFYLVYYEDFSDIKNAIMREKQIKNWHREWRINLIKSINPEMKDLSENFI